MGKRGSSQGNAAAAGTPPAARQPTQQQQLAVGGSEPPKPTLKPPSDDDLAGFSTIDDELGATISKLQTGRLTEEQIKTFYGYSDSEYDNINGVLRGIDKNVVDRERALRDIKRMSDAIDAEEVMSNIIVKRGVNSRELSKLAESGQLVSGATYVDKGFPSTTRGDFIGVWNRKEHQLTIKVPKGAKALFIEKISELEPEKEVILPAGQSYKVVSGRKTGFKSEKGTDQWEITVELMLK